MDNIVAACCCFYHAPSGAVLLGKRGPEQSHPGTWCNPGGKLNEGEDALAAAKREVREEMAFTPLFPAHDVMIHTIPATPPVVGRIAVYYFRLGLAEKPLPVVDGRELTRYAWLPLSNALLSVVPIQPGTMIQLRHLASMLTYGGNW